MLIKIIGDTCSHNIPIGSKVVARPRNRFSLAVKYIDNPHIYPTYENVGYAYVIHKDYTIKKSNKLYKKVLTLNK